MRGSLIASVVAAALATGASSAAPCPAAAARAAHVALAAAGASTVPCPDSGGPPATAPDLCAVLDGDGAGFFAAWDARLVPVEQESSGSERRYRAEDATLRVRLGGGVAAIYCSAGEVASTASSGAPEPENGAESRPATVGPELPELLRLALARTGASLFECPEELLERHPGKTMICAFFDGDLAQFDSGWILPDRVIAQGDWQGRGRSFERSWLLDGTRVHVRLNNGAVAVTYDVN